MEGGREEERERGGRGVNVNVHVLMRDERSKQGQTNNKATCTSQEHLPCL